MVDRVAVRSGDRTRRRILARRVARHAAVRIGGLSVGAGEGAVMRAGAARAVGVSRVLDRVAVPSGRRARIGKLARPGARHGAAVRGEARAKWAVGAGVANDRILTGCPSRFGPHRALLRGDGRTIKGPADLISSKDMSPGFIPEEARRDWLCGVCPGAVTYLDINCYGGGACTRLRPHPSSRGDAPRSARARARPPP